jgi:hypothetical protein
MYFTRQLRYDESLVIVRHAMAERAKYAEGFGRAREARRVLARNQPDYDELCRRREVEVDMTDPPAARSDARSDGAAPAAGPASGGPMSDADALASQSHAAGAAAEESVIPGAHSLPPVASVAAVRDVAIGRSAGSAFATKMGGGNATGPAATAPTPRSGPLNPMTPAEVQTPSPPEMATPRAGAPAAVAAAPLPPSVYTQAAAAGGRVTHAHAHAPTNGAAAHAH